MANMSTPQDFVVIRSNPYKYRGDPWFTKYEANGNVSILTEGWAYRLFRTPVDFLKRGN